MFRLAILHSNGFEVLYVLEMHLICVARRAEKLEETLFALVTIERFIVLTREDWISLSTRASMLSLLHRLISCIRNLIYTLWWYFEVPFLGKKLRDCKSNMILQRKLIFSNIFVKYMVKIDIFLLSFKGKYIMDLLDWRKRKKYWT